MKKVLSISIAAYNSANDLPRCIESLINSDVLEKLDIIIVNDGSNDNTAEVANTFVNEYPNSIRLINKQNGGHGSTINASIQAAVGKYYKILDSDDWVDSRNLSRLVEYLEANDVDMVLNSYEEVDYLDHKSKRLLNPNHGIPYEEILALQELNHDILLYMHSLTFMTSVMKQMGSIIDEHCFYVDMEYCVFPLQYVKSFVCLEYPVYQYLLGSATQSMNMNNLINRRDQHLKVTKRLVHFYEDNKQNIHRNVLKIIELRLKYAVYQQYVIFLHMNPKEAKHEIVAFDTWLKNTSSDIYRGPDGNVMKYIQFNRIFSFSLFVPCTRLAKRVGILK